MFEIGIKNGYVYDGAGNPCIKLNIGISNCNIIELNSKNLKNSYDYIIDAKKLAISPGFIDIHAHSDFGIVLKRTADNKIFQGVTTEINGNCGSSAGPLVGLSLRETREYLEKCGLDLKWSTLNEYFKIIEKQGSSVNVASHVGHSTIRIGILGYENRAPTNQELEEMKSLVEKSMKDGAIGLSTVLTHVPTMFASTSELIELCKIASKCGGYYAPHIRGENNKLENAIEETIKISRAANIPVQIAHHKAVGETNWGKVKNTMKMIKNARKTGLDLTYDMYPYTASAGNLKICLPEWAREGSYNKIINRINDQDERKKMIEDMRQEYSEESFANTTFIGHCQSNPELEGKNFIEISDIVGKTPYETALDLLVQNSCNIGAFFHRQNEDDIKIVISDPFSMICSDIGIYYGQGKPHPRAYGTFPKVIGRYARDEGLFTIQEAIRKMTSAPAQRAGFYDRGLIKLGMKADIVIFDRDIILDRSTYNEPLLTPLGIQYVLVNGVITIEKGKHTGKLGGVVLRNQNL